MNTPNDKLRLGIVGCGDFLRIQEPNISTSAAFTVDALFDPLRERAASYAAKWPGARAGASAEEVVEADTVDVVALFVPPWARRPLVERAAAAGKHIITTKPLAPAIADCEAMLSAVKTAGVKAAVIYNRTESRAVETLKRVFESGRFGRLALFKQDWIHHYPQWNQWALDPTKNGGPFMDAMIHNLNIARYLMGRPAERAWFFSDRHAHPDLSCADTEFMKIDFAGAGAAHLFITWAADLKHESGGNYREHYDIFYLVSDQGWRITVEGENVHASRLGETQKIPLVAELENPFAQFARWVKGDLPHPSLLASLEEAAEDIRIIRRSSANPGQTVSLG